MQRTIRSSAAACLAGATILFIGCGGGGPELGKVSGTVTLDGQPLGEAHVVFQPVEEGSPSDAWTDEQGHYELTYLPEQYGALVGKHNVQISTYRMISDADVPGGAEIPERVPPQYNAQTTLVEEVEPGSQTIDFNL